MKKLLVYIVLGLLAAGAEAYAGPAKVKKDKEIARLLKTGAPVYMPTRAAKIVSEAPAAERKEIALKVLEQGIKLRPQLAPALVSALSEVAPTASADLAAAAVNLQPAQVDFVGAAVPTQIDLPAPEAASPTTLNVRKGGAFQKTDTDRTKPTTGTKPGSPPSSHPDKPVDANPSRDVVSLPPGASQVATLRVQRRNALIADIRNRQNNP